MSRDREGADNNLLTKGKYLLTDVRGSFPFTRR